MSPDGTTSWFALVLWKIDGQMNGPELFGSFLFVSACCLLPTAFPFMLSSASAAGVAKWQTLRT